MTAAAQATAVIAAAGAGERLGAGGPKALVEVGGRPLVAWSLDAMAAAGSITDAVIAGPEDHLDELLELGGPLGAQVVAGGATRSDSVAAALELVGSELVAIHDAARPLVTAELIDALVGALADAPDVDGVIAAAPIADTVKRADRPRTQGPARVAATEDRELLWAAQTPQVFRLDALRAALAAPGADTTDEAMIIERAGGGVLIHPAPATNMKVTTPDDLRVAELLLASR